MLSIDERISCITYHEKFHHRTALIFSKFIPLPDSGFQNLDSRFWIHLVFHTSFHRDLETKANMFCIIRTSFNWKDNYYVLYTLTFSPFPDSWISIRPLVQRSRHIFAMIRYRKNARTKAKFERKGLSSFKFHFQQTDWYWNNINSQLLSIINYECIWTETIRQSAYDEHGAVQTRLL